MQHGCSLRSRSLLSLDVIETCMPRTPSRANRGNGPQRKKSRSPAAEYTQSQGMQPNVSAMIPGNGATASSRGSNGNRLQRRVVSPPIESMQQEVALHSGHAVAGSSDTANGLIPTPVHFKLISRQNDLAVEANVVTHDDQLGFLIMDSRNATFVDVRAAIKEEFDPDTIPGSTWKFVLPSLGPISARQEQNLGSVARFFEKAFEARLGDGSVDNPFQLSLLSSC